MQLVVNAYFRCIIRRKRTAQIEYNVSGANSFRMKEKSRDAKSWKHFRCLWIVLADVLLKGFELVFMQNCAKTKCCASSTTDSKIQNVKNPYRIKSGNYEAMLWTVISKLVYKQEIINLRAARAEKDFFEYRELNVIWYMRRNYNYTNPYFGVVQYLDVKWFWCTTKL